MTTTNTRNATLPDLLEMLKHDQVRKHDLVVPATAIRSENGVLIVTGAEPEITFGGVTSTDGRYVPTRVCDEGISGRLNIPLAYLRRMRENRPDLYDANVNGWLLGASAPGILKPKADPDNRSFLLRCFKSDDGNDGIARAFLSDRYSIIENIDVLMAALDGINAAGIKVEVVGGDLTERKMRVRVMAPEVQALAPVLLKGYRSPYSGATGDENPVLFAGFEIANSEVGVGAFTITPRMVVQICTNGMTITKDALRRTHLGSQMDDGVIRWSEETQQKNLELVRAQTADAVRTFLDVDYMTKTIERLEERAETVVETVDAVKDVTKNLGYTEAEMDGILAQFIRGGQTTLGGVVNAATAYAQEVTDGDRAAEIAATAVGVLL
jgi:hypothetical protein